MTLCERCDACYWVEWDECHEYGGQHYHRRLATMANTNSPYPLTSTTLSLSFGLPLLKILRYFSMLWIGSIRFAAPGGDLKYLYLLDIYTGIGTDSMSCHVMDRRLVDG